MQVRCNTSPSACGYYRGGHCGLFDEACADMHPEGLQTGLEIRCYLDPASCRDYREDGFCVRHCCDCAKVHVPGIWEDGQDREGAD